MGELKRLIGKKYIFLLLICVFANIMLYLVLQANGQSMKTVIQRTADYNSLIKTYTDQQKKETNQNGCFSLEELERMLSDNDILLHQIKACYVDGNYEATYALHEKLQHLCEYPIMRETVQQNVDNLIAFSIFSNKNSFSYNNIILTGKQYEALGAEYNLKLENDLAAESLTDYYIPFFFIFFLMIMMIYNIYRERENQLWLVVHASKRGRVELVCKRLITYTVTSIVSTVTIYGSTIISAYILYGGWESLFSRIQQLNGFSNCILKMNILTYYLMNMVVTGFVVYAISVVFWLLFLFISNRNISLFIVCLLMGAEAILYNSIEIHSVYAWLKYINVFSLFNAGQFLRVLRNWGWGKYIFTSYNIILFAAGILMVIGIALIVIESAKRYPQKDSKTMAGSRLINKGTVIYQYILSLAGIWRMEWHKLVISSKGIIIMITVIGVSLYFCQSSKMTFSEGMINRDKIYLELGGEDYSELLDYINQIKLNYEQASDEYLEMKERYENGLAEQDEYISTVVNMQNMKNQMTFIAEFIEKEQYVRELEDNGIKAYMISDRGYEEIFGEYSLRREQILLLLLAVGSGLLIINNISMESGSGMERLIKCTLYGRILIWKKIIISILLVTLLFLGVYICDYIILYKFYGMPYLQAPVISLTFMRHSNFNMKIFNYMMLQLLLRYMLLVSTIGISLFASTVIGKTKKNILMAGVTVYGIIISIIFINVKIAFQISLGMGAILMGVILIMLSAKEWQRGRSV